jgi:hypothetical protein
MLPLQHHASFSTTLKGFMVSLYARLKPFQHKINPHDYAMSLCLKHRAFSIWVELAFLQAGCVWAAGLEN